MKTVDYKESLLPRLRDREYAAGYLDTTLKEETTGAFLIALDDVIEAQGETTESLASKINASKQSVDETLSDPENVGTGILQEILKVLGYRLSIEVSSAA